MDLRDRSRGQTQPARMPRHMKSFKQCRIVFVPIEVPGKMNRASLFFKISDGRWGCQVVERTDAQQ